MNINIGRCDANDSELRENVIVCESVADGQTDRGWIDAGLFGALVLVEEE